jgi:membrane-bound lytic murein transglycosylase MltF
MLALLSLSILITTPATAETTTQAPARQAPATPGLAQTVPRAKWTGDLDGMIKRRTIRVLVPYSKTYYFVDRAVQRGISYDLTRLLEADLNKKLKTGHMRLSVVCIPVNRGEMISGLLEGRGDIAMGNLTITPERLKQVDFTQPFMRNAVEIVITGPGAEPIATVEDLSGKEVYIRRSSSYYQSIETLNAELARARTAPVKVVPAPENLEAEDILEMVHAGLVKMTIVEDYLATFWQQIFPKLTPHPDVAVRTGGDIAWMVRKDSPRLKEELDAFIARMAKSGLRNDLLTRYLKNTRWVKGVTSTAEVRKFEQTVALFRKYGDRYDVEYLLLMAQGYQESALNQSARSPVGAIGIMQVMPSTGKEMRVGDISQTEPNIHAGAKFLRATMDEYYANEPMDRLNKTLFTFASYNAGPRRIGQLRGLAAKRGLDPNIWFNNVELMAAEKIGRETVTYVSNIYKYYLAYQMIEDERAKRQKVKEGITGGRLN